MQGWVRTFRNDQFIALNDGLLGNLQLVIDREATDDAVKSESQRALPSLPRSSKPPRTRSSDRIEGDGFGILGDADPESFPFR